MSERDRLGHDEVVAAMLDSVIVVGLTGQIESINPATISLLGYVEDELVGRPISILFADEQSALKTTRLERPKDGRPLRKEDSEYRHKSGDLVPVSVIGAPLLTDGKVRGLILVARDLRETRQLVAEVRAAKAAVETKLAEARDSLLRSERLATLGTLSAGVGHELANIGTVLSMSVQLLRAGEPLDDEILASLAHVETHVLEHAQRLLTLGTPGPDTIEVFELAELAEATILMLQRSGRCRHVDVTVDGAATVRANPVQIEQVLVNLIFNAADATAERADDDDDYRGAIGITITERAGRARCAVTDNGRGIEPERLDAVFDSFHTSKPTGEGTGLGLAVVKQIIEAHHGAVTVDSVVGRGTTFAFDLALP